MDQFGDIRPYNDDEVPEVMQRLVADDEFIAVIASLRFGSWVKPFSWLLNPILRFVLSRQLNKVKTTDDFQFIVKKYMDDMIESTTTGFTVSGLDKLDPSKPYLFMSNHRDIALDPAFLNYALYHNGHDTVRIAIGDNLLTKSYVSDLMRVNKSFVVKRSAKGPRQILAAYKNLSAYIRQSIENDASPIWIAQREGRAKDGVDRTQPAIIKMLAMGQQKKVESFSDYINKLHIVPVSISYELDPCDGAKARELCQVASSGSYQKSEHEDAESIALGISGNKGDVHVSFGEPLHGEFEDADAVAEAMDKQVVANYVLHPSNFFAYKMLHGDYPEGKYSSQLIPFQAEQLQAKERAFQNRMYALPENHRAFALGIYANVFSSKQHFGIEC